ncbi:LysR family transcriptional regulator [Streptomyces sp. DASNCL29]|nr:LysR family transcriptional regulator [Streptomyces sp. DASNCL29]
MPPPVDLDLRLVHSFTVIAEHRHFGRAAEALHITQPSLSRQIHRLEQQLGARLLDRTPRGSRLTEAGQVFLHRPKRCCAPRLGPSHAPRPRPGPAASPSATPPHPVVTRVPGVVRGSRRPRIAAVSGWLNTPPR